MDAIRHDRSFSSESEFQRWLRREEAAAPTNTGEREASSAMVPPPTPASRDVPRCEAALRHLAPIELRGTALVCWAKSDIFARMIERSADTIGTLLAQLADNRVRQLIVEMEPQTQDSWNNGDVLGGGGTPSRRTAPP